MPIVPIATPRFSGGKIVTITLEPNGINIPAPMACNTRPLIIIGKLNEIAQTKEPNVNSVKPIINNFL